MTHDMHFEMANNDSVIWMDGTFIPWPDAKVHVLTHTLHYGLGVFEGIRAYHAARGTAIFRLQAHIDRLFDSAHILGMPIPFDKHTITEACLETVRKNRLDSAYIRPMCFYGAEEMGLRTDKLKAHVMVAAWNWDSYLGDNGLEKGIRIKTSSYTRHHVNITMCKAKANGHYINSMLALREALDCGYDEALLLDTEGYVSEGSGENIFIFRNGVLCTPELTSALEGITRDTLLTLAREEGLDVREKKITRDEVYIANEAFFTGTAAEVTPIREMDGRTIGDGQRGHITTLLQKKFFDLVHGRLPLKPEWLSYV